MKCVRVVGQGIPIKLSDDDAFRLVERDRDAQYCSKSFWKEWYADSMLDRGAYRLTKDGRIV